MEEGRAGAEDEFVTEERLPLGRQQRHVLQPLLPPQLLQRHSQVSLEIVPTETKLLRRHVSFGRKLCFRLKNNAANNSRTQYVSLISSNLT